MRSYYGEARLSAAKDRVLGLLGDYPQGVTRAAVELHTGMAKDEARAGLVGLVEDGVMVCVKTPNPAKGAFPRVIFTYKLAPPGHKPVGISRGRVVSKATKPKPVVVDAPPAQEEIGFKAMPQRYDLGGIEVIDVLRAALGEERFLGWCIGNVLKYRLRAGKKGDPGPDLDKANFYEEFAAHVTRGTPDPRSRRKP